MQRMSARLGRLLAAGLAASFLFASGALAQPSAVETAEAAYSPGQPIEVTFEHAPGHRADFATFAPAGAPDTTNVNGQYLGSQTSGRVTMAPLYQEGPYEVRIVSGATGQVVARSAFSIGTDPPPAAPAAGSPTVVEQAAEAPASGPRVRTQKSVYAEGEPVVVEFEGAPARGQDFVAFARLGLPDTARENGEYLGGRSSGSIAFPPWKPGIHEVRLYEGGSGALLARATFAVGATCLDAEKAAEAVCAPALHTVKDAYAPGEPITVRFEGAPGNSADWIGIVELQPGGGVAAPAGGGGASEHVVGAAKEQAESNLRRRGDDGLVRKGASRVGGEGTACAPRLASLSAPTLSREHQSISMPEQCGANDTRVDTSHLDWVIVSLRGLCITKLALRRLLFLFNPRRIFYITGRPADCKWIDAIDTRVVCIDEAAYYPAMQLDKLHVACASAACFPPSNCSDPQNRLRPFGWYLQQFIKLGVSRYIADLSLRYVLWDADNVPLFGRELFSRDGRVILRGNPRAAPYGYDEVYHTLLGERVPPPPPNIINWVVGYMVIDVRVAQAMLARMESRMHAPWPRCVCKALISEAPAPPQTEKRWFSEYQTYASWLISHQPHGFAPEHTTALAYPRNPAPWLRGARRGKCCIKEHELCALSTGNREHFYVVLEEHKYRYRDYMCQDWQRGTMCMPRGRGSGATLQDRGHVTGTRGSHNDAALAS